MYTMSTNTPGPLQPVLISQVTGKKYPDTKAGRGVRLERAIHEATEDEIS